MSEVVITPRANGPYVVQGPVRLVDQDGNDIPLDGEGAIALCRCGQSQNKPFCDGSHRRVGFQAPSGRMRPPAEAPQG